jgi:hypothetical protein
VLDALYDLDGEHVVRLTVELLRPVPIGLS